MASNLVGSQHQIKCIPHKTKRKKEVNRVRTLRAHANDCELSPLNSSTSIMEESMLGNLLCQSQKEKRVGSLKDNLGQSQCHCFIFLSCFINTPQNLRLTSLRNQLIVPGLKKKTTDKASALVLNFCHASETQIYQLH